MSISELITPEQCKAARALLRWDQGQLAVAANVSRSTVANFETGKDLMTNNVLALQAALERGGIEFIKENGGGAGLRLKKPRG